MIDLSWQTETLLRITDPAPVIEPRVRHIIRGDEELAERGYRSRTAHASWTQPYRCTPSVVRLGKQPIEQQGDFRVNITPMRSALLALNGGDERKLTYLFDAGTGLYNTQGYPKQAYVTTQRNEVKVIGQHGDWWKIQTLTPQSSVAGMTYRSHPEYVHKFDLVCWVREDETTRHHYNTPRGLIQYYLVTVEGWAWINKRYVKEVER